MPEDHVEIALLRQRQNQDEARIAILERKFEIIDRKVLKGQIALVILVSIGTFVGWFISISDKVRSWFH